MAVIGWAFRFDGLGGRAGCRRSGVEPVHPRTVPRRGPPAPERGPVEFWWGAPSPRCPDGVSQAQVLVRAGATGPL